MRPLTPKKETKIKTIIPIKKVNGALILKCLSTPKLYQQNVDIFPQEPGIKERKKTILRPPIYPKEHHRIKSQLEPNQAETP